MKHYTTTEARKHLSAIVSQVRYQKIVISIGRRNEEEVLVVPKMTLNEELPISEINAQSSSFQFLEEEPDLYSLKDLKKRYV
jgi:PHD/YefM family antitoxin component YafN of YafNO toxin-antitoxin module